MQINVHAIFMNVLSLLVSSSLVNEIIVFFIDFSLTAFRASGKSWAEWLRLLPDFPG